MSESASPIHDSADSLSFFAILAPHFQLFIFSGRVSRDRSFCVKHFNLFESLLLYLRINI